MRCVPRPCLSARPQRLPTSSPRWSAPASMSFPSCRTTGRCAVERRAVERRMYDRREELATAAEIAEPAAASATPGEPIEDAVDKMLAAEIPVLPVVSSDNRLEGLLVLDDLRHVPELVEGV